MSAENRVGDDPITERARNRSAALAVAARTGILTTQATNIRHLPPEFPHHVGTMVARGHFATRLDAKHQWQDAHSIQAMSDQHAKGAREHSTDFAVCFVGTQAFGLRL
jgi:hypothetical protein